MRFLIYSMSIWLKYRNAPTNRPELNPEAQVHERYIDLMCRYESDLIVYRYLRGNENYRLEETLAVSIARLLASLVQ